MLMLLMSQEEFIQKFVLAAASGYFSMESSGRDRAIQLDSVVVDANRIWHSIRSIVDEKVAKESDAITYEKCGGVNETT